MIESLRGVFKRHRDSPAEGQVTLDDDTETTIFDRGTIAGDEAYRLQTIILNLTLNSHASITVRIKADVNGSLETVESNTYNSAQVTDVFGDVNPDRLTGSRVAVTAEGSNASPATSGTVDHSISFTSALSK